MDHNNNNQPQNLDSDGWEQLEDFPPEKPMAPEEPNQPQAPISDEEAVNELKTTCILGCEKKLVLRDMKTHLLTECVNVEVECPQLCGKKIARKAMMEHVDHLCKNTRFCELKEHGCTFVARGVDCEERLKHHMTDQAVDHVAILAKVVKSHSDQLENIQKPIEIAKNFCAASGPCRIPRCAKLVFSTVCCITSAVLFFSLLKLIFHCCLVSFLVVAGAGFLLCRRRCRMQQQPIREGLCGERVRCRGSRKKKFLGGLLVGALILFACFMFSSSHQRYQHHNHHHNYNHNHNHNGRSYTEEIKVVTEPKHQNSVGCGKQNNNWFNHAHQAQQPQPPQQPQKSQPQQPQKPTEQKPQQHQIRPFKTCMLEPKNRSRKDLVPVYKSFSNYQYMYTLNPTNYQHTLEGLIFQNYFHGSVPVYIYENPKKQLLYTVDFLVPEEFPTWQRVGKLGYIDADRLNC